MRRGRIKAGASLVLLLVLLMTASALALATPVAQAPDRSRINIFGTLPGVDYTTEYDQSRHLLTFKINAASSDWELFKEAALNDEWGLGGRSQSWRIDLGFKAPANAASSRYWFYDQGELNDSQLHSLLEAEPVTPADAMAVGIQLGSYLNDNSVHSVLPIQRSAGDHLTMGCIWLDADGNEIGFEKLRLVVEWDSLAQIPLEEGKTLAFPSTDRVRWNAANGIVFAQEPGYDEKTGILNAVIDTAKTDWALVIANHYAPSDKNVTAMNLGFAMYPDAQKIASLIYGGGSQIGDVLNRLYMNGNANAYDPQTQASLGIYEESSQTFYPNAGGLYGGRGVLACWLDANGNRLMTAGGIPVPYELVRFNITLTDDTPFEVTLNKVPATDIVADYTKTGAQTTVSTGSVAYENKMNPAAVTEYVTAVLAPDVTEDTSSWTVDSVGWPYTCEMADPAQTGLDRRAVLIRYTAPAEDEIRKDSLTITWRDANGSVRSVQVLEHQFVHGTPRLWPEYITDLQPFPASSVSVSALGGVDGTSVSYDAEHGIVRQVLDSEKLVAAAQKEDLLAAKAQTSIRFTPPEGTVRYAFMRTGNGILYGAQFARNFGDTQPTENQFYALPSINDYGRTQSFFVRKDFTLADGTVAQYYLSDQQDYAGSLYGGFVDLYYWYNSNDEVIGKNYIVYMYDAVELVTQTEVLEDESQLSDSNNGKKKPLIIANGKELGYGQGKLGLRAERYPSSEGTHHYELRLVNDANAEVKLKGMGTLYLPYPEGYDETNYDDLEITIAHYNASGTEVIEVFSIANGSIQPTKHGLRIEITSMSPFVVSWKAKTPDHVATPTPTPIPTAVPTAIPTAIPLPSATPVPAEGLPQTGDATPLVALLMLLAVSAGAIIAIGRWRRSA